MALGRLQACTPSETGIGQRPFRDRLRRCLTKQCKRHDDLVQLPELPTCIPWNIVFRNFVLVVLNRYFDGGCMELLVTFVVCDETKARCLQRKGSEDALCGRILHYMPIVPISATQILD